MLQIRELGWGACDTVDVSQETAADVRVSELWDLFLAETGPRSSVERRAALAAEITRRAGE